MNKSIDTKFIVRKIYEAISWEITSLQALGKDPKSASKNLRDNQWDVEDYAEFEACCSVISRLLAMLDHLKIPKSLRDKEFEKEAGFWSIL